MIEIKNYDLKKNSNDFKKKIVREKYNVRIFNDYL